MYESKRKKLEFYGRFTSVWRGTSKIKGELYDYRYKKINITTNQYDLYKDNNILDSMEQMDFNINELKYEKVYFFGRTLMGFAPKKLVIIIGIY